MMHIMWETFAATILAVPFYYLWNYLAPIYFQSLSPVYQSVPFWNCVGLFLLIAIARLMVLPHGYRRRFFV